MSKENTIVSKRRSDGSLVRLLPDGGTVPMRDPTDWTCVEAMTEEEVHAAALADPDAHPSTPDRLAKMKPVPRIKTIRRALRLTQEEFAARYHIPLGTLRDWEQGVCEPDQTARAYLRAIAGDPAAVRRALEAGPGR
jgi:putative transcriptional regulator